MKPQLPRKFTGLPKVAAAIKGATSKFPGPGAMPSVSQRAAARREVAELLARARQSPIGHRRELAIVEDYLVELIARGGSFEEFVVDMAARAQAQVQAHRPVIDRAVALARLMRPADVHRRFLTEVVGPARSGSISGPEAWARTDAIVGRNVRTSADTAPPPQWTVYPAAQVGVSAIVGVQYAAGICGPRYGMVCYAESWSVSIGASVGGSGGVGVSVAPKPPPQLEGLSITVGVGCAYGGGFDVGVGLVPKAITDWEHEVRLDTVLDGFSVAGTGGAEVNVSIGLAYSRVLSLLPGIAN